MSCHSSLLSGCSTPTLFIEPGSPWENGHVESFNSRLRDELLDGELFLHIDEMKYVAERSRMDYNHYRSHGSLGYTTPASFAGLCRQAGRVKSHTRVLNGSQGKRNGLEIAGAKVTVSAVWPEDGPPLAEINTTVILPGKFTVDKLDVLREGAHRCPIHNSLRPEVHTTLTFKSP